MAINRMARKIQKMMGNLRSLKVAIKNKPECTKIFAGERLASVLNNLIDGLETDERSRADIIEEMGRAAGIAPGTVNQILNAEINCPPINRLEGFAEVLGTSTARLRNAAESDGCNYGDDD